MIKKIFCKSRPCWPTQLTDWFSINYSLYIYTPIKHDIMFPDNTSFYGSLRLEMKLDYRRVVANVLIWRNEKAGLSPGQTKSSAVENYIKPNSCGKYLVDVGTHFINVLWAHNWNLVKWPVTRKMFPFDDVIMISFASGNVLMIPQDTHLHMSLERNYGKTGKIVIG